MSNSKTSFPQSGFVRLSQIIGKPKANPPIPAFIPVSRSTWLHWVQIGFAPKSVKIGPKTTVCVVEEIREFAFKHVTERLKTESTN
jgi:prophage regulatory protein